MLGDGEGLACGMRPGSYKRLIFIGSVQMLECRKIHLPFKCVFAFVCDCFTVEPQTSRGKALGL